jgi:hypothetical protein
VSFQNLPFVVETVYLSKFFGFPRAHALLFNEFILPFSGAACQAHNFGILKNSEPFEKWFHDELAPCAQCDNGQRSGHHIRNDSSQY